MVGALVLLQDGGPLLPGRLGNPGAHETKHHEKRRLDRSPLLGLALALVDVL